VSLAVSTPNRLQSSRGLPTLKESGYSGAPSGTGKDTGRDRQQARRCHFESARLAGNSKQIIANRLSAAPMTTEQYASLVTDDVAPTIRLGKDARIEPLDLSSA